MSLFKSREWWEVNLGGIELYDSRCLLVLTLKNDEYQSILIGNHEGFLRLFSPQSKVVDGVVTGYSPNHLLLEIQLSFPILQIDEGALVLGAHEKQVAVLHPKLFSVYMIKKIESNESNSVNRVKIELNYQHVLRHSAHSFVLGSFAGVRGRHFVCIQSLDGLLSFYEQENFAFQLYHPNFLLPFQFAYLSGIDSFLFFNGFLTFECFSYEALATCVNSKRVSAIWEYRLGEVIKDIQVTNKEGSIIIVLGEKNLYGLNENGTLIFSKYLDYKPVAFLAYLTKNEKRLIIIIASEGQTLNLYEETTLKWSLKINITPICIKKIILNGLPGGLLLLSENGFLQCIYLGTHPSIYVIPPLQMDPLNLPKLEAELKVLQEKISNCDLIDPLITDLISVEIKIDKGWKDFNGIRICDLIIEISGESIIRSLQALAVVESPLTVTQPSYFITNFSEKTIFETSIFLGNQEIPLSLNVHVIITYVTNEGLVRFLCKECVLPLNLVAVRVLPIQEAQYKLTISTNKQICGIDHIFKDFFKDDENPNVISFKYLNSKNVVTIFSAKTTQKYRLQSDSLPHLSLLLSFLLQKFNYQYLKDFNFTLNCSSFLPLDIYFEKIKTLHKHINSKNLLEKKLSKETSQYRMIQKKILSNVKDISKSISNLYEVLSDTSKKLLNTIDELKSLETEITIITNEISSLSRLMTTLLKLTKIEKKDLTLTQIVINPFVNDNVDDQGWLEYQEAAATFLLRTLLAKSLKETQKLNEITLEPLKDTFRLSKHISSVLERVTKNSYLLERNESESKKETNTSLSLAMPAGAQFVSSVCEENKEREQNNYNADIHSRQLTATEKEFPKGRESKKKLAEKFENSLLVSKINEEIKQEINDSREESCDDSIWDVKIDEMII